MAHEEPLERRAAGPSGAGANMEEASFAGYDVSDQDGHRIGKVDDLFLNERDEPEYVGVKMGFLGTRSTLIPVEVTTADDDQQRIVVDAGKERLTQAPTFYDDRDITPEFEREVRAYYGLDNTGTVTEDQEQVGSRSMLLEDLSEEDLVALAGRQRISVADLGSGFSNVSQDHDRYLAEEFDDVPGWESGGREPGGWEEEG